MTLSLSRLLLNPLSRDVRRDLGSVVALHRTVMSAFPEADCEPRRTHGVLFRLEVDERRGRIELLVQSGCPPNWGTLPSQYLVECDEQNPAVKSLDVFESLPAGRELTFRLRANATKRVTTDAGSKRVELRGDSVRLGWLRRKAEAGGFALCCDETGSGILIREEHKMGGSAGKRQGSVTLQSVLFQGRLTILDADQFGRTLREGIGPAKAYGCGLLSLAP